MNYQLLEQYRTMNRKRLEPTAKNSGQAESVKRLEKIMPEVREIEKSSAEYLKNWTSERDSMQFTGMSPVFLTVIALCMMAFPIYTHFMEGTTFDMVFGLWILPGLALGLRVWIGGGYETPVWHWLFHVVWFVFCVIRGGIGKVTLFGSQMTWLWVYYLGALVIVLVLRLIEGMMTVWPTTKKYKRFSQSVEKGEQLLKEASSLYTKASENQEAELKNWLNQNKVPWQMEERKPWFVFPRTYNEYRTLIIPGNSVKTGFKERFQDRYKECEIMDEDGKDSWSYFKRTYKNEELGYFDVSADEIRQLLGAKKIYPFYSLGLPEVSDEFRYSIFRHRWDYTEITKSYDHYTTVEERDSQEQLRYDRERKIDELSALGSTAENYVASSGHEMVAKDKYLKEKAKHREAIGREKYLKEHDDVFEKEKHFSGDEIATVLVYSPSDKLIGVYCADSLEAVSFTLGEAEKKMNFKLSPMVTAFGESQRGMLYMRYLN